MGFWKAITEHAEKAWNKTKEIGAKAAKYAGEKLQKAGEWISNLGKKGDGPKIENFSSGSKSGTSSPCSSHSANEEERKRREEEEEECNSY